jgi:hypothetical protein
MDVAVGGALPLPWSWCALSFLKLEKRTIIFVVYVMRLKGSALMLFPITEHFAKSDHNSSFYLACGPETGPLIIFVYGWPDLATNCAASLPSASAASPRICDAIHDCFRNEGHAYRRNLKRKFLDLENAIRHSLKTFGIRIKGAGRGGFAQAVREAVANDPLVTELIDAMLNARAALWKEYRRLHDLVIKFVAGHELCRRFMQIPGVGPVAALSFVTAIDDPSRFKRSRDVAAYFGLTSRRWQLLDRRAGADQQGRRWRRPRGALRGGQRGADPLQAQGQGQDLGDGDRQALVAPQGDGRGGAQARRHHACDVGRRHVLLRRSDGEAGGRPRARRRQGGQAAAPLRVK